MILIHCPGIKCTYVVRLKKFSLQKLQKPIINKLDNITEFTQQIVNPKNVLAIEEDRQGRASLKGTTAVQAKGEDKNDSK
jgi:hypothetical protein